jgi:hypothetical protein
MIFGPSSATLLLANEKTRMLLVFKSVERQRERGEGAFVAVSARVSADGRERGRTQIL